MIIPPATERLIFRPHQPDDLDPYCAMEADPEIRRYAGGRPRTREDAELRFKKGLVPITNGLTLWATVLKATGEYIGRAGVYPHFDMDGNAIEGEGALGFFLATDYWGKGLATEAGRALLDFGFGELELKRVIATVQVGNDRSVNVMNKLGFKLLFTEEGARSFYHFAIVNPSLPINPAIAK